MRISLAARLAPVLATAASFFAETSEGLAQQKYIQQTTTQAREDIFDEISRRYPERTEKKEKSPLEEAEERKEEVTQGTREDLLYLLGDKNFFIRKNSTEELGKRGRSEVTEVNKLPEWYSELERIIYKKRGTEDPERQIRVMQIMQNIEAADFPLRLQGMKMPVMSDVEPDTLIPAGEYIQKLNSYPESSGMDFQYIMKNPIAANTAIISPKPGDLFWQFAQNHSGQMSFRSIAGRLTAIPSKQSGVQRYNGSVRAVLEYYDEYAISSTGRPTATLTYETDPYFHLSQAYMRSAKATSGKRTEDMHLNCDDEDCDECCFPYSSNAFCVVLPLEMTRYNINTINVEAQLTLTPIVSRSLNTIANGTRAKVGNCIMELYDVQELPDGTHSFKCSFTGTDRAHAPRVGENVFAHIKTSLKNKVVPLLPDSCSIAGATETNERHFLVHTADKPDRIDVRIQNTSLTKDITVPIVFDHLVNDKEEE